MIGFCDQQSLLGSRDAAILLFLLDTGVRATECCNIDLSDIDRMMRSVVIKKGKGGKPRTLYLGKRARRFLRSYLKKRKDNCPALWITRFKTQLRYGGLKEILKRRAKDANIQSPSAHDFRRAFALESLRNGIDVYSLQRLMGHADLQVLRRYLAQTNEDIRIAHGKTSPVDNW